MHFKLGISFLFIFFITMGHAQNSNFSPEDLWRLKRLSGGAVSPDQSLVLFQSTSFQVKEKESKSESFLYDLRKKEKTPLKGFAANIKNLRWVQDNNLAGFIIEDDKKNIVMVSSNQEDWKTIFSKSKDELIDFKISPKGNYLITLERVKTKPSIADLYPDYSKGIVKIYDDLMYRHWDTWEDEYSNQLFLYELSNGIVKSKGINLLEGTAFDGVLKPFGGLGDVEFYKEEKILYVSKKKLGLKYAVSTDSDIYAYDIQTKTTSNWTEPYQGYDMHPRLHEKTNHLAWLSMANDGFEADKTDIIIRYLDSQEDINLTKDIDLTISSFLWNKEGNKIYFLAVTEATNQYFELDIKTKKHRMITNGDHDFTSIALGDGKLIGMQQSMLAPNELFEVDIKSGKMTQLTNENENILAEFSAPTIEKRWVTTSDQKQMLVWVILPPNFDKDKKYPTLLYCQGGPQSAVSQFFSFRWNFRLMASQGYIVVAPNRRGLPGFGQKWNDEISEDWGGQSIRDYLAAIDDVSKEKYVDKDRRGAVGASYGGYSVYYLAGVHQKRFKTFISHAGLFNMTSWYGTTEELFFANWDLGGAYWDSKAEKSYKEFSPHNLVNNWDTPILILHGGKDFRVPETQGFEAFQAAKLKGLKSKLVYFPDENHWILDPHNAMIWQHEFYNWLKETLD